MVICYPWKKFNFSAIPVHLTKGKSRKGKGAGKFGKGTSRAADGAQDYGKAKFPSDMAEKVTAARTELEKTANGIRQTWLTLIRAAIVVRRRTDPLFLEYCRQVKVILA